MKFKLFKNKIEPSCLYCSFGRTANSGEKVFCTKKGIVLSENSCSKFKYDPLKRVPKKINFSNELSQKDFEI